MTSCCDDAAQVASYGQEEEASLEVRMEYHGGDLGAMNCVPEDEEAPPPQLLGRLLTLPVRLRLLPSLQARAHFGCEAWRQSFQPSTI